MFFTVNFVNGKFVQWESPDSSGLDEIDLFLMDQDPAATLALHFSNQLSGDLGQANSAFVNDGHTIMLYRDEVESISASTMPT